MVSTRLAPAATSRFATSLAVIGTLRLVLSVLPGVTVKGQNRRDPLGRGPPRRVNHDEQLHQVMIRWRAGRLDHEDILTPDVLVDLHERLAVRK